MGITIRGMEALRKWLEITETTQQAFADQMGVSQPTVHYWVSGSSTPTPTMLLKISDATGISLEKLLEGLRE